MTKLGPVAALLALPLALPAADPGLLQLVMPDAKVIAGLQVNQARNSLFGQYVLSHMQVDNAGFQKFAAQTGFDPRNDVSEIVMASNWKSDTAGNRWLVVARGTFNLAKIAGAAQANGGVVTTYQGVTLVTYAAPSSPDVQNGIAFFDASTAALGDLDSVKAAIDRKKSNAPSGNTFAKAQEVSAKNDFWFVTLVPLSEFSAVVPNSQISGAMQGNLLAGINQASGGIRFGDTVLLSTEAVARSDKDAQALVDVVKFFAGLVQMNRQSNPEAGQVATLLDTLNCQAAGNVTTISLAIPEQQLEQMLQTVQQNPRSRPKAAPLVN
jgi:hypothetical protein